jgi:fatty acid desaturase
MEVLDNASESVGIDNTNNKGTRVKWYRTPLDRDTLARLNAKSNVKGFLQSIGHLGLLALAGGAAIYGVGRWPWWSIVLLLFLHGTFAAFMINAVHELVHKCVFKTQWLNEFFVRIYAFIGWIHFEHFYNSHIRHHQFTLHPPDDLEVVLPTRIMVQHFFRSAFINYKAPKWAVEESLRLARGGFKGEWETKLYPADEPEKAAAVMRWARLLLSGHTIVLVASLLLAWLVSPRWLMLPVLVSLTPGYGKWLFFLCNNTQHIGLQDNVADFRLCCRTFTVNPLVQFLYWHMNFHIEHHMYAAVPCYNLGKLHRAILHDLPPCPAGIIATWKEIAAIQKQQDEDPEYQHVAPLPGQVEAEQVQPVMAPVVA